MAEYLGRYWLCISGSGGMNGQSFFMLPCQQVYFLSATEFRWPLMDFFHFHFIGGR